jgi:hypothetical protein
MLVDSPLQDATADQQAHYDEGCCRYAQEHPLWDDLAQPLPTDDAEPCDERQARDPPTNTAPGVLCLLARLKMASCVLSPSSATKTKLNVETSAPQST